MRFSLTRRLSIAVVSAFLAGGLFAGLAEGAQAAGATAFPRTPDGKPDLSGFWQVMNTANFDIQDHTASEGVPAGQGVVEGNEIPYQPWAAAKKKENFAKRATEDPESKCFMPGVPRATYQPFPFQIMQMPDQVAIMYEFAYTVRFIHTDGSPHPRGPIEWWMGDSRGHWEGDTLVADVVHFIDSTWFDRAGNHHSDALHVVERYTPIDRDHLNYEATIEDPKVFTRPWKMSMVLYRHVEKNFRVLEYVCHGFKLQDFYPYPGTLMAKGHVDMSVRLMMPVAIGMAILWMGTPVVWAGDGQLAGARNLNGAEAQTLEEQGYPKGGVYQGKQIYLQKPMDTKSQPWTGKRMPDGQPDVHGTIWRITNAGNGWLHNPQVGASDPDADRYPPKPSRIIDTPDGLPPYQPWALALREKQQTAFMNPTRPENFDPQGQCLSGIPKLNYYVSNYTILQSPGYIAFVWEIYHQYRVIPIDGGPHVGKDISLWMGDGRGHWDGNTLVVDTTNVNGKSRMNIFGDFFTPKAHLTERFVFRSPELMIYEVTIDDPTVYTRPWTMRVDHHERSKDLTEIWEDTCKEYRDTRPSALEIPGVTTPGK